MRRGKKQKKKKKSRDKRKIIGADGGGEAYEFKNPHYTFLKRRA